MTSVEERPDLTDDAPVGSTIETGPLGPARIPASRYTSPAWAALETSSAGAGPVSAITVTSPIESRS